MNKKDLLAMRPLRATAKMMEMGRADVPQKIPGRYEDLAENMTNLPAAGWTAEF